MWQKAPGHLLSINELTGSRPSPGMLRTYSSYTGHYYTDRGYGRGEHPWPVVGKIPTEDYVAELDRMIRVASNMASGDERVMNAREWFLWFPQDSELQQLLDEWRGRDR